MFRFRTDSPSELLAEDPSLGVPGQTYGLEPEIETASQELYRVSKEFVAPVIAGFADSLLEEADGRKIIFAARDGLGSYVTAKVLKERFEYGDEADADQLKYAYVTRQVVWNTQSSDLERYFRQEGLTPGEQMIFADIGMYGSFIPQISRILPGVEPRFLISRNPNIPGYADGPNKKQMASMARISGNMGVHFLEDTYSGPIQSPTHLVERDGRLEPNTLQASYPPDILEKRTVALDALTDYVRELDERPVAHDLSAITALDDFLSNPTNYAHLMVPHER